ncbi:MAG: hypothetical protein AAB459_03570 [Patescibacteria group bacterium]
MVKKSESKITPVDILTFLISGFYMQSVLTVAHHTAFWVHDGTSRTVEPPAVFLLVVGLLLSAYSCYKNKGKFSTLVIISVTVFATASLFWLSGLRTNFYF